MKSKNEMQSKEQTYCEIKKIKITKYSVFVGTHTINANTIMKMVYFQ
jgi:hypothetical protein